MLTDFLVIVAATTTISLTWRALKDNHPRFKEWVAGLPIVGSALSCGFCAALWFSLAAVILANPLAGYEAPFTISFGVFLPFANLMVSWLTVSTAVLFVRNVIVALLEFIANSKPQRQIPS